MKTSFNEVISMGEVEPSRAKFVVVFCFVLFVFKSYPDSEMMFRESPWDSLLNSSG